LNNKNGRTIIALVIIIAIAVGLALAGSQGGNVFSRVPIFALCIGIAFLIQWIAFIPAYLYRTEKFYDLTGSITYLTVLVTAVSLSPSVDARSFLLFVIIAVWAIRLGYFLFTRIRAAGEDRRFREIKNSFTRFLMAWTLQGLWIAFALAAALAAITSTVRLDFDLFAAIGFIVWLLGFSIEVIADKQKSDFKARRHNKGKFINSGLWSWSRHPNYFGEIVLWIGVAIIALPILKGWQWVTLISPIFIIILLTRISGVPLLEAQADKKWGGQADYEAYKASTSVLIPMPPSNRK
jgi:steroid 5-alpha reductase family enzyme